jgi:hypothetical protein
MRPGSLILPCQPLQTISSKKGHGASGNALTQVWREIRAKLPSLTGRKVAAEGACRKALRAQAIRLDSLHDRSNPT